MSIRLKRINTCKVCGSEFHPFQKEQVTCSVKCFNQIRSKHRRKRAAHTCKTCGKSFEVAEYRDANYCSKDCWSKRKPKSTKVCPNCKKEFSTYQREQVYCSRSCARADTNGRHGNAWKDGRTRAKLVARNKKNYRAWRLSVYERDGYKCTDCGSTENLHAHHIKSFEHCPESRYELSNGKTVCENCHSRIHGRPVALPQHWRKPKQT